MSENTDITTLSADEFVAVADDCREQKEQFKSALKELGEIDRKAFRQIARGANIPMAGDIIDTALGIRSPEKGLEVYSEALSLKHYRNCLEKGFER